MNQERKITLIVPPAEDRYTAVITASTLITSTRKYPALGLGYIAAILEKKGYTVRYVDMFASSISVQELQAMLRNDPPKYVGITTDFATINPAKEIARVLKRLDPSCKVIVGGCNLGIYPDEIMQSSYFDVGVVGEGDLTIIDLMDALESGRVLDSVKGIVFKKDKEIIKTPPREHVRDLDSLPFPARHLMPLKEYTSSVSKHGHLTTMLSSRGCPFNCLFCVRDHDYRERSIKNVVDEIGHIVNDFHIEEIYIFDPTFTANKKRVIAICKEIIKRKIDVTWVTETRVDCVSLDLLRWMKRAGCTRVQYGVESVDPGILKELRKNITLKQIYNAFKWTKRSGLEILASFMIGSPGDTVESILRTINTAVKLNPDYAVFTITTIFPGTDLHDRAVDDKIIDPEEWKSFMRGESPTIPTPIYTTAEFDRTRLVSFLKYAYRRFYLRPSYVLKRILKIRSFYELVNNIAGLRSVLTEILLPPKKN
jgi:anaerobic magnesium-protoporphyrin IX monomethyl ester cyclase